MGWEPMYGCRATIFSPSGDKILNAEDFSIQVNKVTGSDINGDSKSDIVLEGWSGGAHCCFTYWIVPLGSDPPTALEIRNKEELSFEDMDGDGRMEIETADGAFNHFDHLSYGFSPFPPVFLRMETSSLRDISKHFRSKYAERIGLFRSRLTAKQLAAFRRADPSKASLTHVEEKKAVLEIVLAHLYSGNQSAAWKALDEMWPPSDRKRIKELILETRKCGILNYVYKTCSEPYEGTLPDEKP